MADILVNSFYIYVYEVFKCTNHIPSLPGVQFFLLWQGASEREAEGCYKESCNTQNNITEKVSIITMFNVICQLTYMLTVMFFYIEQGQG